MNTKIQIEKCEAEVYARKNPHVKIGKKEAKYFLTSTIKRNSIIGIFHVYLILIIEDEDETKEYILNS